MFSIEQVRDSIQSHLEKQSDLLKDKLKQMLSQNFFSQIDLLDFVAYIEPTRFELSIQMFSMDTDANEVFYERNNATVFSGSMEVLQDIPYYQLSSEKLEEFFDFYEHNEKAIGSIDLKRNPWIDDEEKWFN